MATEYRDAASGADSEHDGAIGSTIVDPNAIDGSVAVGPEPAAGRRKRRDAGVPRGPRGTGSKKEIVSVDLSSLAGMLAGVHAMLAMAAHTPELEITEAEASQFMKAGQNVLRHYSVQATQKTIDWLAFVGVTVTIYGTRIAAVGFRKREERQPKNDNVVQFNNPNSPVDLSDYRPAE